MATGGQPVTYISPSAPLALIIEESQPLTLSLALGSPSLSPGGPAGGVLAGTYPNPSRVAQPVQALTDAASIALDASLGNSFSVTLGGNRTLANPTNSLDGQRIIVAVKQPASGGPFTLSFASAYEFATSLPAPVLSTAAGAVDLLGFVYSAAAGLWRFAAFVPGFAS